MKWIACALLFASTANAAAKPLPPYDYHGLAIDLGVGASFPAADDHYTKFADPTVRAALHLGYELVVEERFLIAPELTFDFVPINTNDKTYADNSLDANFQRYRGMVGVRFLVRLGVGELYARVALGVDYITGTITAPIIGSSHYSSTAFGFEPGVGVQFQVVRHFLLGLMVSFPVAAHDFGKSALRPDPFTAVDVDLHLYAGFRY